MGRAMERDSEGPACRPPVLLLRSVAKLTTSHAPKTRLPPKIRCAFPPTLTLPARAICL